MGQHKTNPIAIAARNGEIEPKKKKSLNKREQKRQLYHQLGQYLRAKYGIPYWDENGVYR